MTATVVVCCVMCGRTALADKADHHCRPNLSPADLERLQREAARPKLGSIFDLRQPRRRLLPAPTVVSVSAPGRLSGLARTVREANVGERNSTLHWAACRAGEMVTEGALRDPWEAARSLAEAAEHAGLGGPEIAATIRSGFKASGVVL